MAVVSDMLMMQKVAKSPVTHTASGLGQYSEACRRSEAPGMNIARDGYQEPGFRAFLSLSVRVRRLKCLHGKCDLDIAGRQEPSVSDITGHLECIMLAAHPQHLHLNNFEKHRDQTMM